MIKLIVGRGNKAVNVTSLLEKVTLAALSGSVVHFHKETGANLYGGTSCYQIETLTIKGGVSTYYWNDISTISGNGNEEETERSMVETIDSIVRWVSDIAAAPIFVSNDHLCPKDDDGMWWNNHRKIPNINTISIDGKEVFRKLSD